MSNLTRREFVRRTALAAAAAQIASSLAAQPSAPAAAPTPKRQARPGVAELRWLDGKAPRVQPGATCGVPWPQGVHPAGTTFTLRAANGAELPVQSWPLATWPDGSLKWTAHALPADVSGAPEFELAAGKPIAPAKTVRAVEAGDAIEVDTGVIQVRIARTGRVLVPQITRSGLPILQNGRLVLLRQDTAEAEAKPEPFTGAVDRVTLEQAGPVRAVVKLEGRHAADGGTRAWLPFIVRLYFYAGGDAVRVLHTIVHDGDEKKDFIRGLGLRFNVPLRGELYDRHVRFSGQDDGLFSEAVRGLTGLRRDPGREVKAAQRAGQRTPAIATWPAAVSDRLQYVPAFADWTLFQANADGFEIRKRTKPGYTWLSAARGQRAGGLGYVGTPEGGVAFGIRNFWQSHPAQLDIRGATGEQAEVTAWLWAPNAGAMDLRGYHDDMGQDTYPEQLEAMQITYEDYEPGYDRPDGVARTSELYLWALAATPSPAQLVTLAEVVRTPPVVMVRQETIHAAGVFGRLWSPADRSTPERAAIEDQLDWYFDFYQRQREDRRWYGFWNYGDVMHSYDDDRHEWKYDVGGFAWDNSELSTDIWIWLYFLHSGRPEVFRFAEAMTRHTGEVDVHHQGRFAPLGSRHNVLHWGCSAKQLRISTAVNRRYYYYLTGDERVGDLMREQVEAARALAMIQANRKVAAERVTPPDPHATEVYAGFGTDWGSIAGAWLTEWERTGDPRMRDRLVASMRGIAGQPQGFFTGGARLQLASGGFARSADDKPQVSHLSAVFGLVEVCAELIELIDVPEFKQAWLEYCSLYNASPEEQKRRFGAPLRGISLTQGHSRLTAYAARQKQDPTLAKRAWAEFVRPEGPWSRRRPEEKLVSGPEVLRPVHEATFVSTNGTAQWGLAAIECLALVGEALPADSGK
ncbi:Tat pathway signal sequence domain protein [Opitutus sp. ER46]|uniref:exo-rhamnogalacturonan lyase family protein n=1 Tax=Opitutus sp. ER46 TaxID=2161864 RepID=UPI000D30E52B|nr:Tat pathway signal sequence domain protein [Opitutus sp. ER46]PTX94198.1 Tat pathway signal sequence domain protein [Opitutus sp. ER46]